VSDIRDIKRQNGRSHKQEVGNPGGDPDFSLGFSPGRTKNQSVVRAQSPPGRPVIRYLANLTTGRLILWCYLIWYLVVLVRYFDPSPLLWLTSLGISAIIGVALVISTSSTSKGTMSLEGWQVFRLFLMPFCVSSFAALVKGRGFILVFSPRWSEDALALVLCAVFSAVVLGLKRREPVPRREQPVPGGK
jgi:hypothetical protein